MRYGLMCYVFKTKDYAGCAKGGISERHDRVLLVGDDIPGVFTDLDAKAMGIPVVVLVRRDGLSRNGGSYFHVIPEGATNTMMGGTFIHTSDSRFPFDYPLPLHDRIER